ncbi:MAG TPA: hypothetical protein ENK00_01815 [Chromatiales bacterium]|nr:hypothetical protein [Chromatiales bacterium]
MAGDKELLIKVRADIRQSLREMQRMTKEIRSTGQASAGSSRQVASLGRSMDLLKRGAAAYLSLRTATALVRQADAYNVLQVRIQTATKATGDYARVSRELFDISQRNGTALETTVSLFQSLARSAPELGASNEEILKLTNAVQQLGVISGASSTALSAGLLQFSQGLAAGVFRAEEFNSILENLPEVAVRIARGMGLTVGELRKGVLEGRVLSREVFESLLKQAPEIAREFEDIPDSVARSSQTLSNAFSKFLGQLDKATGITGKIAEFFNGLAEALAGPVDVSGLESFDLAISRIERKITFLRNNRNKGFFSPEATTRALEEEIRLERLLATLKKQRAQFEQSGQVAGESGSGAKPTTQPPSKSAEQLIQKLEQQAATFGKTTREIALYRIQLEGANRAQIERAKAAAESIAADEDFEAAVRASEAAVKAENAAYHDWLTSLRDEGRQVVEDTLTNQERLNQKITRYRILLEAGAISQTTFNKAVSKAREDFRKLDDSGDDAFKSLEAAVRGWGDEFTNTLSDMVVEGKLQFRDLADAIIRDLTRIAIQQAIVKPALASIGFATGGPVVGPGTSTSDSIPARLSAGEYVVNARAVRAYGASFLEAINQMKLPRYSSFPQLTISRPGARFASGGLAEPVGAGSGNIKIQIDNKGQPVQATDANISFDGQDMIIRVMLDDGQRGGPFSTFLERKYNLRRS